MSINSGYYFFLYIELFVWKCSVGTQLVFFLFFFFSFFFDVASLFIFCFFCFYLLCWAQKQQRGTNYFWLVLWYNCSCFQNWRDWNQNVFSKNELANSSPRNPLLQHSQHSQHSQLFTSFLTLAWKRRWFYLVCCLV